MDTTARMGTTTRMGTTIRMDTGTRGIAATRNLMDMGITITPPLRSTGLSRLGPR